MAEATGRRRPGPQRSLTREQILDAALEILAADGLDAVSFRSVSRRLGVNPMALYTYVASKDELLAGMFDAVVGRLDESLKSSRRRPATRIVEYFTAARRLLIEHADLYRLARPMALPGMDWAAADRVYALFAELGLDSSGVTRAHLALMNYTVGNAMFWSQVTPGDASLAGEVDARFRHVRGVLGEAGAMDPEREFQQSLAVILRAFVAEHAT